MRLHLSQHRRDVVGEDDEEVAGLEAVERLAHRGRLVADVLDAVVGHAALDEPLADEPGDLAARAAAEEKLRRPAAVGAPSRAAELAARSGRPQRVCASAVRRQSTRSTGSSSRKRLAGLCDGAPQAERTMARET